jgi:cysteine sulfinate desulfinase/cysteine desulfurase-like protein
MSNIAVMGCGAGASPREIIFTSGATESNNLAIKGVAHFYKEKKKHIITTQTEHKCVLDSCRVLQQQARRQSPLLPTVVSSL